MLNELIYINFNLKAIYKNALLKNEVKTMFIDYHQPFVERIWFKYKNLRVFLHKIHPCTIEQKALYHPHEWESAMLIKKGKYIMNIGHSKTNKPPKTDCTLLLNEGTMYEMIEPNAWHSVEPYAVPTYTLMVTGKLNGRKKVIEPNKKFRKLTKEEILDIETVFNLN